ncbi:BglG family transcription antiterminator [Staphylococcus caledonicus]|uniref:BglG family transcription antiterminator n=1 Tax=Staphylococcus sp. acrmy TaxID=2929076 RepID=UPI001F5A4405|nr:BglG family transcription antiterminator [Staphylococcus sp. acrmy]MCI2947040.1 BglG family transcription antiterminator [Staphylococcus sp. acrmy]
MLSNRQVKILNLLITNQDYITITDIASEFGTSHRTIQYDLEYIESIQDDFKFKLLRNKALGVKIKTDNKFLAKELEKHNSQYLHLSKEERILSLTLRLFDSNIPVSSKTLSEYVNVSRRTIMSDLKEIQKWLNDNSLQLSYLQNKGFLIIGDEEKYRKAYANRIQTYFKNFTSLKEINLFSNQELTIVRNTVINTLNNENYQLVQIAIDALIYHILIAIRRLKENYSFEIPKEQQDKLSQTYQFQIASNIIKSLEDSFEFKFPLSETIFITLHLLGAKTTDTNEIIDSNNKLEKLLTILIYKVGAELGIDLQNDNRLYNGLLIHLKPAIHRLKFNMEQKNPLKNEVYERYGQIAKIIENNLACIEKEFNVLFNTDEIAFLTIHFASSVEKSSITLKQRIKVILLCGSGVGTSQLLKTKLNNVYPEFEIVDAYSVYQINEEQLISNGIDYIISTVPVNIKTTPVVQVDPFLDETSRYKLNEIINNAREQRFKKSYEHLYNLKELLPLHRINNIKQQLSRDESIALAIQPLIKDEIVQTQYIDEIKEQLEKFGPYMVISPHIALIHASSKYVKGGAGFAITYFENGIEFNHESNDPVYLVIALATVNPQYHLKGLAQLSNLLLETEKRETFLKGDMNEIKNLITNTY